MFSLSSTLSRIARRAEASSPSPKRNQRDRNTLNWLRHNRPRRTISLVALGAMLSGQWLGPSALLLQSAQAQERVQQNRVAPRLARAPKAPVWYTAKKRVEARQVAAMRTGMRLLLAEASGKPLPVPAVRAKLKANLTKPPVVRGANVVSHANTILAPSSARSWHGDAWGEVRAQGGAHILRQSLPGNVKPSAPLYQPEPRVSMHRLDLSHVPTQEELSAGGGCCGTMQPAAPADPYGYAAKVDLQLKAEGFPDGLRSDTNLPNPALHAVLAEARAGVQKARAENQDFGAAVQTWNDGRFAAAADLFQKYVEKYPQSPWTPEALIHLADNAKFHVRPQEAEALYKQVVDATSDELGEMSYELHWKAYQHWADMYLRESRWSEASPMLANIARHDNYWRRRTWADNQLRGLFMLRQDKKVRRAMRDCGPRALAVVFDSLHQPKAAKQLRSMPAPGPQGSSMADLRQLAKRYGVTILGFAVRDQAHPIASLQGMSLPVILHYSYASGQRPGSLLRPENSTVPVAPGGHFVVVRRVDETKHRVWIENPQTNTNSWLSEAELAREWSGNGLMVAAHADKIPLPQRVALLPEARMRRIHGGCNIIIGTWGVGCNQRINRVIRPSCSSCHGEPEVSVNALSENVFIHDVPLWVRPSMGPSVEIGMSYNSQDSANYNTVLGNKWSFEYGSHVVEAPDGYISIFQWDGHEDSFAPNGTGYTSPRGLFSALNKIGDHAYSLTDPYGGQQTYGIPAGSGGSQILLLSQEDRWGKALTFHYITVGSLLLMDSITDADGGVTTLTYDTNGHITAARDPHERAATFAYDTNGNLVQVVDMEGNAFQYTYDEEGNVTELNTAMGPWTFQYYKYYNPNASGALDYAWTKIWNPLQDKPERFELDGGNDNYELSEGFHYIDHRGNDTYLEGEVLGGSNGAPPQVCLTQVREPDGATIGQGYADGATT